MTSQDRKAGQLAESQLPTPVPAKGTSEWHFEKRRLLDLVYQRGQRLAKLPFEDVS